jgi:hypothetical protein
MPVPAIACGSDQVSIEMSDAAAVGQGEIGPPMAIPSPLAVTQGSSAPPVRGGPTPPTTAAPSAARATSSGAFGVVEGDPVWWVGVLVGNDVAQVEMTLPDGSTDHMAPIDGVAVVAHHITLAKASLNADPYMVRGAIHLFDASGRVLAALTLPVERPTVPGPLTTVPPANPGGPVGSGPIGSSVGGSPDQSGGAKAGASGPPSHAPLSSGVMTICPRILVPNVPQAGARGTPAVVSGSARSGP